MHLTCHQLFCHFQQQHHNFINTHCHSARQLNATNIFIICFVAKWFSAVGSTTEWKEERKCTISDVGCTHATTPNKKLHGLSHRSWPPGRPWSSQLPSACCSCQTESISTRRELKSTQINASHLFLNCFVAVNSNAINFINTHYHSARQLNVTIVFIIYFIIK